MYTQKPKQKLYSTIFTLVPLLLYINDLLRKSRKTIAHSIQQKKTGNQQQENTDTSKVETWILENKLTKKE